MRMILIAAITVGTIIAFTAGILSYQQTYNQKCIEGGDKVTGFLQCTGMNCDFGVPQNTVGISIPKKIFVSEEAQIFPKEANVVLGTNNTVMWANHAPDEFVLVIDDGARIVLIPSCTSAKLVFDKPGVFEYHEKSHPWITGKVTVLDGNPQTLTDFQFGEIKNNIEQTGYDICDIQMRESKIIIDLNKIFNGSDQEQKIISKIPPNVDYEIIYHEGYTDYFINTITAHTCE